MYPFVRLFKVTRAARRAAPLPPGGTHVSHHICWPWDLDPWRELNNGRTLTLFDLGRLPLAIRTGLIGAAKRQGWAIAVAGGSIRYRRRVHAFERLEMRSRLLGWDRRFLYVEQSTWKRGECASHVLLRLAVTGTAGIVNPSEVLAAMGHPAASPSLPAWVEAWIAAEAQRPWPPER
ncbi:acyl-CoA thioesterase [Ostreiculturibacter nitratireducens]|uniref:acyl-CoA thioesterase n=1 Tax=Ostreiculturibacter nitratireducens TaxID=3075226 RepID=UPI0031B5A21D